MQESAQRISTVFLRSRRIGASCSTAGASPRPRATCKLSSKSRDDPGEGFAADRTVRIKAVAAIEGTDKGGVTVNVNTQTNVATIQPGYVIRLGKFSQPEAAIEQEREPLTIEQG